ncbi:MAG: S8 family serine peptidase, partial [Hyphomicrobium sp.]
VARGKGAVVAVIDSGVDQRHPDLAGVVGEEIDVTGGSIATDVADPHGTAIAGIIAARGLVKGVAPMARVLSIKAFRPASSGAASISTTAMLVAGIDKAVGKGAQVLNMSFAGVEDALVHRLVKAASAKGVLMVAAAGNKGPGAQPAFPAGYPEVLAVTATDAADRLYLKANRGSYVAVAAPGVDVLAPGAARSHQLQSGTSFAAAHVSGVLALLIERHPRITPAEASEALAASAVDLGRPGRDDEFGAGLISAAGALRRMGHVP